MEAAERGEATLFLVVFVNRGLGGVFIGGAAFIAWAGRRRDLWSMSVQQIGTVIFCVFALAWVFRDSLWRDARDRANTIG